MRIPKGINPTISKTIAFDIAATLQQVMQVVDDLHARRIAPFTLIEQTPLKRIRWFQQLETAKLFLNVRRYGGRITLTLDLQPLRDWEPSATTKHLSDAESHAAYMRQYRAQLKDERDKKVAIAEALAQLTGIITVEELKAQVQGGVLTAKAVIV